MTIQNVKRLAVIDGETLMDARLILLKNLAQLHCTRGLSIYCNFAFKNVVALSISDAGSSPHSRSIVKKPS